MSAAEAAEKDQGTDGTTQTSPTLQGPPPKILSEVLQKNGLVYSEKGSLSEVLCKPKILPIKSAILTNMEEKAKEQEFAAEEAAERDLEEKLNEVP